MKLKKPITIRGLRKRRRMTQSDLAFVLSVRRRDVSSWEKGLAEPEEKYLEKICTYFSIEREDLIVHE